MPLKSNLVEILSTFNICSFDNVNLPYLLKTIQIAMLSNQSHWATIKDKSISPNI